MALTDKFAEHFSHTARHEGARINSQRGVKIEHLLPDSIEATVQSGQTYEVFLGREKGAVRYSCECPYYQSTGETCKHVWATMLFAQDQGHLDQWTTDRHLELLPEDEDLFIGEDEAMLPVGPMIPQAGLKILARLAGVGGQSKRRERKAPEWKQSLANLREVMRARPDSNRSTWPAGREVLYVIDVQRTLEGHGLTLEVDTRERRKDGNWGKPKKQAIKSEEIAGIPDVRDREILSLLHGAKGARDTYSGYYYNNYDYNSSSTSFRLGTAMQTGLLQRMCATGRCFLRRDTDSELLPLTWDEAGTWELWVVGRPTPDGTSFLLTGELRRGEARMEISEPVLLVSGGMLFTREKVAPMDDGGAFAWVVLLRSKQELLVPASDRDELLQQLMSLPELPRLDLPDELRVEEVKITPQARLRIRKPPKKDYYSSDRLKGELSFDYDGAIVSDDEPGHGIYQPERRRLILRDAAFESDAAARLRSLGFKRGNSYYDEHPGYELAPKNLPQVIRQLTTDNWHVEADGQLYRQPGEIKIDVTSGIDWFELHGTADFGGQTIKLPELLAALRRGEKTVRLGDGTFGVLPEQWLQKYGLLADMGTATEGHIRFGKTQVGLLDALLASQPEATCDEVFQQARQRMRDFSGITPADPPPLFQGILRPYQREGLGWMQFLREFHFGGCLADDMGLGKTVQVLALLENRRTLRTPDSPARPPNEGAKLGPSLVVVPRSLIFNWQEEATKFAPQLRVLDHTGIGRAKSADVFGQYDLILTTYGTLRNDITFLKDVTFDYVILDEAQAIKNAASESAKAVRLLGGSHRLALSGTPVQNHLGELWSLFEFLNPGMLGTARAFQATGASTRVVEQSTRELLSRALRPFILRRTK
ncbi:MAG TPA: SNF2-related protein, partial [Tepidisphaeraceae bacterium]|nr:SNF2-related protein [Tepidisphaeraceae bacterium]